MNLMTKAAGNLMPRMNEIKDLFNDKRHEHNLGDQGTKFSENPRIIPVEICCKIP
jgi:hypothetical protein